MGEREDLGARGIQAEVRLRPAINPGGLLRGIQKHRHAATGCGSALPFAPRSYRRYQGNH